MVLIAIITTWVYNVENVEIRDDFLWWTFFHVFVVANIIMALFIRYRWNTWIKSALPGPGSSTLWTYFVFELLAAVGGVVVFLVFLVRRVNCTEPEPCSTVDHEIVSTYLIIVAAVAIVLGVIGAVLAQFIRGNLLRLQTDPTLAIKATAGLLAERMLPYVSQLPPPQLALGFPQAQGVGPMPMPMIPPVQVMPPSAPAPAPIVTYGPNSAGAAVSSSLALQGGNRVRVDDPGKVSMKYE